MILSWVLAFFASFLLTLSIERLAVRWNLMDHPGKRKVHKTPVPRMGGTAFFSVIGSFVLIGGVHIGLEIVLGAVVVFVGGLIDDVRRQNSVGMKLAFQVPAALIVAFLFTLENLQVSQYQEWALRLLLFLYVLFMINAANLMDNMNGLTSGLSLIWFVGLGVMASKSADMESDVFTLGVIAAAVLGFYVRNFPSGKIFMGDQGSQLLGFLCASVSVQVLTKSISAGPVSGASIGLIFLAIFLLSLVYLADVLTVVIIRLREHRPLWQGDQCHLSFQLVRQGLSKEMSAMVLYFLQGSLTMLGLFFLISYR